MAGTEDADTPPAAAAVQNMRRANKMGLLWSVPRAGARAQGSAHSFEVVSLFANLHSSTCPVSSKAGFYSGERDRVDQQETLVLSVKDRA